MTPQQQREREALKVFVAIFLFFVLSVVGTIVWALSTGRVHTKRYKTDHSSVYELDAGAEYSYGCTNCLLRMAPSTSITLNQDGGCTVYWSDGGVEQDTGSVTCRAAHQTFFH